MKSLLLIPVLLLLSSCSLYENLTTLSREAKETYAAAKSVYAEAQVTYTEAKAAADTDKDGTTTPMEWMAYLLGVLGVGGGGLLARNAKSNARKDVMEKQIAVLEAK